MGRLGRFEWDDEKSEINLAKHGIGLAEATAIWDDPQGYFSLQPFPLEERWLRCGAASGRLWAAIFTLRGEHVRIISVRRARTSEERAYVERQREP